MKAEEISSAFLFVWAWVKTQVFKGNEKSEAPIAIEGHQIFAKEGFNLL
jgi:hypothetical protein